jgi:hypothetical protein
MNIELGTLDLKLDRIPLHPPTNLVFLCIHISPLVEQDLYQIQFTLARSIEQCSGSVLIWREVIEL